MGIRFEAADPALRPLGGLPGDDLGGVGHLRQVAQPEEVLGPLAAKLEETLELGLVMRVEARVRLRGEERRVPLPEVRVEGLPEQVRVPVDVQEVVPDLEGDPERPSVALERVDLAGGAPAISATEARAAAMIAAVFRSITRK